MVAAVSEIVIGRACTSSPGTARPCACGVLATGRNRETCR